MRWQKEENAKGPRITGLRANGFAVDGQWVEKGLLLSAGLVQSWSPPPLSSLNLEALAPLFQRIQDPQFILLGTGAAFRSAPGDFTQMAQARGFGVEAMDSRNAARLWGVFMEEERRIIAALYPMDYRG